MVSDRAHCRGNSFDKEQGHLLSSKATYREFSEKLDMLKTHISIIYHQRAADMTRALVSRKDGEGLLLKKVPKKLSVSCCSC